MKNFLFFTFIITLFTASSCRKECPPDKKIGTQPLSEKSLAFFPYTGNPKLIFKDNEGKELVFNSEMGVHSETTKIAVYKTCTELKYDGQSAYDYFEGTFKNIVLFSKDPNISINLSLTTSTLRPEEELFFDQLTVDVMAEGSIGRGELVTDFRFTEAVEESEFNIQFPLNFIGDKNINEKTFSKVYETDNFMGRQAYYTKKKGIVGFQFDQKVYHLDRIE